MHIPDTVKLLLPTPEPGMVLEMQCSMRWHRPSSPMMTENLTTGEVIVIAFIEPIPGTCERRAYAIMPSGSICRRTWSFFAAQAVRVIS